VTLLFASRWFAGIAGYALSQSALIASLLAPPSVHATDRLAQARTTPAACTAGQAKAGTRVLLFTRTKGFRHSSIPKGIAAVRSLGTRHGFAVEATEDPAFFTDSTLRRFSSVVFLSTTGDVLDDSQQSAFERYIRRGGGYVGVHAASDTEYEWPWYGRLVGAYFRSHPATQPATVDVVSRAHPATRCLPARWTRRDEWYDFKAQPVKGTTVLATLDESTYRGGRMGKLHPVIWYHRFDGGRSFYTELGHTDESYTEPAFLTHLAGGIVWASTR
jgi:type 1 glutamine amidotransferase